MVGVGRERGEGKEGRDGKETDEMMMGKKST